MQAELATRNGILRRLDPYEFEHVARVAKRVELPVDMELAAPGEPIRGVWFPETGFASVVAAGRGVRSTEIAFIGCEGAIGFATVLGLTHDVHRIMIQQDCVARFIEPDDLRDLLAGMGRLRRLMARYAAVMLVQTGDTAHASAQGRVVERLARWLVMAHDRVEGDRLTVVHRFLAAMLGVRRAGVTDALHTLEGEGLIRAERGAIEIRNREGLIRAAGGLYGFPERAYERLMGE